MPLAARRPCIEARCSDDAVSGGRCQSHAQAREHQRDNWEIRRWYRTARWCHPRYGLRAIVLARQPLCVDCLADGGRITASTDVDHEVPHRGNPRLFWDTANLRGRCHACHTRKTGRGA